MFQSARIKLTLWYLLIIMTISVCFSAVIFNVTSSEVDRAVQSQRFRVQRRLQNGEVYFNAPNFSTAPIPISDLIFGQELVNEIKRRFLIFLSTINFSILILSGGLAYFLAGITLKPIKIMMDEQNRFIADASHELKTPLTALKSAMEVHLRDPHLKMSEARQLIQENIQEVNKLQSLSESLLQLAQYQSPNTKQYSLKQVALKEIIDGVVKKISPVANQKKVKIKTEDIVEQHVMGNEYGLQDLFTILIDNAVKYSNPNGTVTLSSQKKDRFVAMFITDEGVGISKKDLPFIFDRFYRADQARSSDQTTGYGLGLSIAKKIVKAHRGNLQVKSIPQTGSTFIVSLPLK